MYCDTVSNRTVCMRKVVRCPMCVLNFVCCALRYNSRAEAVDTSVAEFSTNATVVIDDQVSEGNAAHCIVGRMGSNKTVRKRTLFLVVDTC